MNKNTFTLFVFFVFIAPAVNAQSIDSLQKMLDTAKNPCIKVNLYMTIAANLVQLDQRQTRQITYADAGKAIDYVLKAIHINAQDGDYFALRTNYDCLSEAYFIQKKYTQAKWFNLQSNYISRNLHDVPHIIYSLMRMAAIKAAIKDYALAQKDLKEAIILASNTPVQIDIERRLAVVYDKAGNIKQALAVQKHYNMLTANFNKAQKHTALLAMQKARLKIKKHSVTGISPKQNTMAMYNTTENKVTIKNGIWIMKDIKKPVMPFL